MRRSTQSVSRFLVTFLLAAVVLSLVPNPADAQELEDVVYLKDGSILRGTIVETVPDESILIRTRDGNQFRISWDRIERMTKEPVVAAPPTAQPVVRVVEGRKSPGLAFFLSFLITGLGQGYNGQWAKGLLMFGGVVTGYTIMINNAADCADYDECGAVTAGAVLVGGLWLWSWIDAPLTASAINRRLEAGMALEVGPRFEGRLTSTAFQLPAPEPARYGVSLARVSF